MKLRLHFLPFIFLAILALLFALWARLLRLGWALPTFDNLAAAHGPLMVSGFLGVLIPLERAVAIRQKWMFAVPLLAGAGWIALLFAPGLGAVLLTLAILGVIVRREPHIHTIVMAFGALAWVVGNGLWMLGMPIFQIVFWWITFLVLTIGGERLELNRVLRPTPNAIRLFSLLAATLFAAALLATFNLNLGSRLGGFALLGLALWFLGQDLARRNLRQPIRRIDVISLGLHHRDWDVLANEQHIIRAQALLAGVLIAHRHNPPGRERILLGDGVIFPLGRFQVWQNIGSAGIGFVHSIRQCVRMGSPPVYCAIKNYTRFGA